MGKKYDDSLTRLHELDESVARISKEMLAGADGVEYDVKAVTSIIRVSIRAAIHAVEGGYDIDDIMRALILDATTKYVLYAVRNVDDSEDD